MAINYHAAIAATKVLQGELGSKNRRVHSNEAYAKRRNFLEPPVLVREARKKKTASTHARSALFFKEPPVFVREARNFLKDRQYACAKRAFF